MQLTVFDCSPNLHERSPGVRLGFLEHLAATEGERMRLTNSSFALWITRQAKPEFGNRKMGTTNNFVAG